MCKFTGKHMYMHMYMYMYAHALFGKIPKNT